MVLAQSGFHFKPFTFRNAFGKCAWQVPVVVEVKLEILFTPFASRHFCMKRSSPYGPYFHSGSRPFQSSACGVACQESRKAHLGASCYGMNSSKGGPENLCERKSHLCARKKDSPLRAEESPLRAEESPLRAEERITSARGRNTSARGRVTSAHRRVTSARGKKGHLCERKKGSLLRAEGSPLRAEE